jgi:hypothetical protein
MDRAKKHSEALPSVHCFNTFFLTKLSSSGYSAIRRWTKKVLSHEYIYECMFTIFRLMCLAKICLLYQYTWEFIGVVL